MSKIILIIISASVIACQTPIDQNHRLNLFDFSTSSLTTSTPVDLNDPILAILPNAVVFLKYNISADQLLTCNGVLIAPFKILTVGHCFFDVKNLSEQNQQPNKNQLTIQYGDITSDSAKMKSLNGQHILSIEVHKDFFKDQKSKDMRPGKASDNAVYHRSDVALITLDQRQLTNSSHFNHFKALPTFYTVDDGTFDKDNPINFAYSMFLSYTAFPDFTGHETPDAHLRFAIGKPSLHTIASKPGIITGMIRHHKHENSVIGLCNGDSGSPLFYKIKGTKDMHILVGITTGIISSGFNSTCSENVIFSSILSHRDWLKY